MRRQKRAKMRYVRRGTVTIPSDVFGSYTGTPLKEPGTPRDGAAPVQDADDL